jgi:hypothetical protein
MVATAVLAVSTAAGAVASPPDVAAHHRSGVSTGLPLGAADLPETRTTTTLQPGVTLTTIFRGVADTTDTWSVEVSSADTSNPDPDAPKVAITDKAEADQTAADLTGVGLSPRVEAVYTPRTADTGGLLGYRVRVGSFATQADAASTAAQVSAAGYGASTVYTGWDDDAGAPPTRGPWHLDVLTIDPKRFTGRLTGRRSDRRDQRRLLRARPYGRRSRRSRRRRRVPGPARERDHERPAGSARPRRHREGRDRAAVVARLGHRRARGLPRAVRVEPRAGPDPQLW